MISGQTRETVFLGHTKKTCPQRYHIHWWWIYICLEAQALLLYPFRPCFLILYPFTPLQHTFRLKLQELVHLQRVMVFLVHRLDSSRHQTNNNNNNNINSIKIRYSLFRCVIWFASSAADMVVVCGLACSGRCT